MHNNLYNMIIYYSDHIIGMKVVSMIFLIIIINMSQFKLFFFSHNGFVAVVGNDRIHVLICTVIDVFSQIRLIFLFNDILVAIYIQFKRGVSFDKFLTCHHQVNFQLYKRLYSLYSVYIYANIVCI